ncbi:MAG: hypothetical protein JO071_06200 [Deltaproteobacteria bacterium]|nr:hypothetical protein [Deltaproteobacteria bacterium]
MHDEQLENHDYNYQLAEHNPAPSGCSGEQTRPLQNYQHGAEGVEEYRNDNGSKVPEQNQTSGLMGECFVCVSIIDPQR